MVAGLCHRSTHCRQGILLPCVLGNCCPPRRNRTTASRSRCGRVRRAAPPAPRDAAIPRARGRADRQKGFRRDVRTGPAVSSSSARPLFLSRQEQTPAFLRRSVERWLLDNNRIAPGLPAIATSEVRSAEPDVLVIHGQRNPCRAPQRPALYCFCSSWYMVVKFPAAPPRAPGPGGVSSYPLNLSPGLNSAAACCGVLPALSDARA